MGGEDLRANPRGRLRKVLSWVGAITLVTVLVAIAYVANRLHDDEPVVYADIEQHFKYGSLGGERGWRSQPGFGIPYWIWIALPELFPQFLPDGQPGRGYTSFGMIYEEGKDPRFDLPIGMSMRRVMGVDRVYFTCAVCHTGSIREAPGGARQIVLGMPANTFDFGALVEFIRDGANHWKFRPRRLMPRIQEIAALREAEYPVSEGYRPDDLNFIDRQLFSYYVVALMRERLSATVGRLAFIDFSTWGPGRVDTFNPPKALLGFRTDNAPERELIGNVDLPSIWNQKARKGMKLHWDGNNCSVDERNISAAFGTGATPPTLEKGEILRLADWLWTEAQPPAFPADRIDSALAAQGEPIYREYCWSCHGNGKAPFRQIGDGSLVGEIIPIAEIGTDEWRLNSYTPELARSQNLIYAGYPEPGEEACREYYENVCRADQSDEDFRRLRDQCYPARFVNFRKTYGYVNMPLDGLWARAPYLHNGSVSNLRELLQASDQRSTHFYIGYDVYDYDNVGFVTSGPEAEANGWLFDTTKPGNANTGHEGYAYGTLLEPERKRALIEYLKTF